MNWECPPPPTKCTGSKCTSLRTRPTSRRPSSRAMAKRIWCGRRCPARMTTRRCTCLGGMSSWTRGWSAFCTTQYRPPRPCAARRRDPYRCHRPTTSTCSRTPPTTTTCGSSRCRRLCRPRASGRPPWRSESTATTRTISKRYLWNFFVWLISHFFER